MKKEIRLTEEMFIALLQGKKLQEIVHLGNGDTNMWTIYPPHYGLYLTHAQLQEMKMQARMSGVREFIELVESMTNPS